MINILKFFLITLVCVLCSGCKEEEKILQKKIITMCIDADPISMDPQAIVSEHRVLGAIFEGLLIPDPQTCEPLPGIAERFEISDDGQTYKFFIRKNARWTNGDTIFASDFVFSAKRALSSRSGCSFIEMFLPIKNAKKFYARDIRDFNQVGIRAIDDYTLSIELEEPSGSFIYFLMQPCWCPLNDMVCESIKFHSEAGDMFSRNNVVSNGPYMVVLREFGKILTLEKNPYYWDYEKLKLDEIKFVIESNSIESAKLFKNNIVDIAYYNPAKENFELGFIANENVKSSPCFGCCYLLFNTESEPLSNKDIRTALSISINKEGLLRLIGNAQNYAAYRLVPVMNSSDVNRMLNEDFNAARKMLVANGYDNVLFFPKLRLLCTKREVDVGIAEFLKKEWAKNLDINVIISSLEWDDFLVSRKEGDFDMVLCEWFGDYPDPTTFLNLFFSLSHQNYGKWKNNEYDYTLNAASQVQNANKRSELLERAEKLLLENMPIVPLYFKSNTYLIKKRVKGWEPNLINVHPWKFITVDN